MDHLPSFRQLPTPAGSDGHHHRLLPEGTHNIGADYRRGASTGRLSRPVPEAGEGPGASTGAPGSTITGLGSSSKWPAWAGFIFSDPHAAAMGGLPCGHLLPHSEAVPGVRGEEMSGQGCEAMPQARGPPVDHRPRRTTRAWPSWSGTRFSCAWLRPGPR